MDSVKERGNTLPTDKRTSHEHLYTHWFPGNELKDIPQITLFSPITGIYYYVQRARMEESFDDAHNHHNGFLWRLNTRFAERYIFSQILGSVTNEFPYDKGRELLRICRAVESLDVGERFGGVLLHSIISFPELVGQKLYSAGIMKNDTPQALAFFTAGNRGRLVRREQTDEKIVSVMHPSPAI